MYNKKYTQIINSKEMKEKNKLKSLKNKKIRN